VYHLRPTGEVHILVAVLDVKKIPKFADVCVKGCMYRLYFKPDEAVVANQDQDEDLLTDDDKGNDADGDKHMGDAVPPPKPQGDKGTKSTSSQPSLPQSEQSHKQATLLQEALDLASEQLFDEINIKVMAEKDSVGWKRYSPLTDEKRRMYNAMVSPPVNPHPFFSDEFEQAAVSHLSSVGGTSFFCYPESTPHHAEVEVRGVPTHIPLGGGGSGGGCHAASARRRGGHWCPSPHRPGRGVRRRGGRAVSPCGWGDVSLSTPTEVTLVAAGDTADETVVAAGDTAATTPERTVLPAKGDTAAASTEGAAVPIGDETELVTNVAPRRMVAPAPTPPGEDAPRMLRQSSRNVGKAEEHTLLKAERLAKKKNLEGISFSSFSDSRIISNLGR
jgi:hypothetical protein